jgi:hypothetical protein
MNKNSNIRRFSSRVFGFINNSLSMSINRDFSKWITNKRMRNDNQKLKNCENFWTEKRFCISKSSNHLHQFIQDYFFKWIENPKLLFCYLFQNLLWKNCCIFESWSNYSPLNHPNINLHSFILWSWYCWRTFLFLLFLLFSSSSLYHHTPFNTVVIKNQQSLSPSFFCTSSIFIFLTTHLFPSPLFFLPFFSLSFSLDELLIPERTILSSSLRSLSLLWNFSVMFPEKNGIYWS